MRFAILFSCDQLLPLFRHQLTKCMHVCPKVGTNTALIIGQLLSILCLGGIMWTWIIGWMELFKHVPSFAVQIRQLARRSGPRQWVLQQHHRTLAWSAFVVVAFFFLTSVKPDIRRNLTNPFMRRSKFLTMCLVACSLGLACYGQLGWKTLDNVDVAVEASSENVPVLLNGRRHALARRKWSLSDQFRHIV